MKKTTKSTMKKKKMKNTMKKGTMRNKQWLKMLLMIM